MAARPAGRRSVVVAVLTAAALVGGGLLAGCSSDDPSSDTTAAPSTSSTTVPPPSTVDDATFEGAAGTYEALVRGAGDDPCNLWKVVTQSSTLPAPSNPTQAKRAAGVLIVLFQATAASAPEAAKADGAVLLEAAQNLEANGEANGWDPTWLASALNTPEVSTAFGNYQSEVRKQCPVDGDATTTTGG